MVPAMMARELQAGDLIADPICGASYMVGSVETVGDFTRIRYSGNLAGATGIKCESSRAIIVLSRSVQGKRALSVEKK